MKDKTGAEHNTSTNNPQQECNNGTDMTRENPTMENSVVFDHAKVLEILPHRYPFLFIDKVIEFEDSVRIVAIKNVTSNEPFFQGHFPGRPVMPGVLILESMAQAGAILSRMSSLGSRENYLYFAAAKEIKWRQPVVPGDTLRIVLDNVKIRKPFWSLSATAYVGQKVVATANLTAAEME